MRCDVEKTGAQSRKVEAEKAVTLVDQLGEALKEIERSHAEKNDRIGRPQSQSHTLRVARAALAKWHEWKRGRVIW